MSDRIGRMGAQAVDPRAAPTGVGVYLGGLQFFFALTWVVYVIYLPELAARAGIDRRWVPAILLLDQAIFAVCDWAVGVAADRVAGAMGRLARFVLTGTIVSCAAFLLLPLAAGAGAPALLALIVIWSVTSSLLRAPPLVLLGRHAPPASQPWLAGLALFGLGAAAAAAPYLAVALKGVDPRVPFALSSAALAAATLGILWAERTLGGRAAPASAAVPALGGIAPGFLVAVALLAIGFQVHFAINSAPLYLRVARPEQLPWLMPVFWVGFNLLMLPASLLAQRFGGAAVMAGAGVAGAVALYATTVAGGLGPLVAAQFVAGGAWGCVLMSACAAALSLGRTGREGALTGGVFAMLAVAAFGRIAMVMAEVGKMPEYQGLLAWAPTAAWLAAGGVLVVIAARAARLKR
jgi:hypothetical protein